MLRDWFTFSKDPILLAERQGYWQWYWALLSTVLAFVCFIVFAYVFEDTVTRFFLNYGWSDVALSSIGQDEFFIKGNLFSFALITAAFSGMLLSPIIVLSLQRGYVCFGLTYGGVQAKLDLFWKTACATAVVYTLSLLYTYLYYPETLVFRPFITRDLFWIGLGVTVLLIQTLAEEVAFRGYLLRIWGAVFPVRLFAVGVLVALFVWLHTFNKDVQVDLWFSVIIFVLYELLAYWVLFRTGSVIATWGIHWMNNVFAVVLLESLPGYTNTLAIVTYTDPVLSQGGTYLFDPSAYLVYLAGILGFIILVVWKRSPFYLPPISRES